MSAHEQDALPRRRRRTALAIVLIFSGGFLVGRFLARNDADWVEVRRGDLVVAADTEGTLRSTQTTTLGPPQLREYWDFKIAHIATEGESVDRGTPILAFDTSDLERRLEQQLSEREQARKFIERTIQEQRLHRQREELVMAEAEARLVKARFRADRPNELLSAREARTVALDLQLAELEVEYRKKRMSALLRSAEAQLAVLRTQERRADRRVHEIEVAIEDMVRTAPMPGTVIYVANWKEEKKKVGDSVWRGESVVELPDLSRMMGEGIVQETYAGRIKEGQPVTIRLDAHPEMEFEGRVASIWKNVQNKSWRDPTKVVRLEVELRRTDSRRMRPGMRFRGRIELERAREAVLLPLQAVFIGPAGPLVYRRTPVGYETVLVNLGRRDDEWVEVLSGVDEGDSVSLTDLAGIEAQDT